MISAIIPTLNEETTVASAIAALRAEPTPCEVVVVDGGSDDRTTAVVRQFGPSVRLIQQAGHGPRGRGPAFNQAARCARGDVLLFLHVDTRLPLGGLSLIEKALADPSVVGGGFLPTFDGAGSGPSATLLRTIERLWRFRTRVFGWFAGDQAPFIRRELFFRCGGYPEVRLAEDWAFAARLRSLGRVAAIDPPVRVSARRHLANGVLRTLLVTGSVEVMYRIGIESAFLAWWYRRWLPRERA